jgi:hypothetical protein
MKGVRSILQGFGKENKVMAENDLKEKRKTIG